jgi:nucleoid DNA-binding protein
MTKILRKYKFPRNIMTKRDLVVRIATETGLNQQSVMDVVQKTLDYITAELAAGRNVELRNFGVFELKVRRPRVGRNPNQPTNEVTIPERVVVKFKAGKVMKEKVSVINPTEVQ